MKGAFQIAKFAGIPVKVHWSFGLLISYVVYIGMTEDDAGLFGTLLLLGFVLLMFLCVVLHEYGHALTARRYNVDTKDIILSPIGGIARLDRLPEKPIEEFYVAIAGPMVNVVIILILSLYFLFFPETFEIISSFFAGYITEKFPLIHYFIPLLIIVNIILVLFNMIPAFPMDGGRVLRSLLSMKIGKLKATQIASYLGRLLAVGIFIYAIWKGNIFTSFIGIFVFFTATYEYRLVKQESMLNNHTAEELMNSLFSRFKYSDTIQTVLTSKHDFEKNFLIFDDDENVVGVLHEAFLKEAIKRKDQQATLWQYRSPKFEGIGVEHSLRYVYAKMQEFGYSILPVYENARLVGVIDNELMNDYLKMKKVIKERK